MPTRTDSTPVGVGLFTFNIGNPSVERAERQLAWLSRRPEDVLVLTETADSNGCRFLAERFTTAGYVVVFPVPDRTSRERGVMLISRLPAVPGKWTGRLDYLPGRVASLTVDTPSGPLEVIGAYVPSRDASEAKTTRKKRFLEALLTGLADEDQTGHRALLGDLNILEPDHQPRYPIFRPFEYDAYRALTTEHGLTDAFRHLHPDTAEYSWVGRTGDGYRYDHAHISHHLTGAVTSCEYDHEPRLTRLSDHSALTVNLAVSGPEPLLVSDPIAIDQQPLF